MTRTIIAIAFAAAASAPAGAQSVAAMAARAAAPSCIESIPPSALTRVPVFAALTMLDSAGRPVPPAAENLLQSVVDRIDMMLGGTSDSLPQGEPGIRWDSVGTGLVIDWHRDGRIGWQLAENPDPVQPPVTRVARLFASALDTAQTAGEVFIPWPSDMHADSVRMKVYFVTPMLLEKGTVMPIGVRPMMPMFTVAAPRQKIVVLKRRPPAPRYPVELLQSGIGGKVTLQFVVDTMGRADSLTIRDLWPPGEPRLEGEMAGYYNELVAGAKRAVRQARFFPAEMGGCKVRQVVQQPFTWLMR